MVKTCGVVVAHVIIVTSLSPKMAFPIFSLILVIRDLDLAYQLLVLFLGSPDHTRQSGLSGILTSLGWPTDLKICADLNYKSSMNYVQNYERLCLSCPFTSLTIKGCVRLSVSHIMLCYE